MKKRMVMGFAAVMITAGQAMAADMPVTKAPYAVAPAPVANWSGLYIGAHIGGGWGDSHTSTISGGPATSIGSDPGGVFGGMQIGYDWQSNQYVFGLVADLSLTGINDEARRTGPPGVFRTDYDWLATIRARMGWLYNPATLLYVHGGVAFADINWSGLGGAGPWDGMFNSTVRTGWTIGFGGEIKMTHNISLFAEYSYLDFGTNQVTTSPGSGLKNSNELHLGKLGANYRF